MNEHEVPPSETNLDSLKQMIGAPDLEQPLLKEDAFANAEVHSARPTWKLPVPKLMLIGAALLPVFAFAGYFMTSSQQLRRSEGVANSSRVDANKTKPEDEAGELRQARTEIAALKSKMALNDQEYIQTQRSTQGQRERPAVAVPKQAPQPRTSVRSVPMAPVRSVSSSPVISYRSPTPPMQIAPIRRVNSVRSTDPVAETDPIEQWQQLARLGSYGTIIPPEAVPPESSSSLQASSGFKQGFRMTSADQIPTAQIAPTSADQTDSESETVSRSINDFRWIETDSIRSPHTGAASIAQAVNSKPVDEQEQTDAGAGSSEAIAPNVPEGSPESSDAASVAPYPTVLTQAEAAILEVEEQRTMQAVVAGANATGRLETPIVLENSDQQSRFLVVLAEPLEDNRGRIAIPAEGKLLVQVDSVSENGMVKLSATKAVWETQAGQREIVLPEQVIVIRGEDGEPLTAQNHDDRGPEIAAMDLGQFAIGAIGRAAELYTRANTRVQTGNGTTIIAEDNPTPNILAGVLEGGTDTLLETITERNERAVQELEQRPNIPYIAAGTPVQIFVNQSMRLPL